jgi:hypothetical protein
VLLLLPLVRELPPVGTQFAGQPVAVLCDDSTATSLPPRYEPLRELIRSLAVQFLDRSINADADAKEESEEPAEEAAEETVAGEGASRPLPAKAWALAHRTLQRRRWALHHATAELVGVTFSQLSRKVAAARALDAAVAAVLTPEKAAAVPKRRSAAEAPHAQRARAEAKRDAKDAEDGMAEVKGEAFSESGPHARTKGKRLAEPEASDVSGPWCAAAAAQEEGHLEGHAVGGECSAGAAGTGQRAATATAATARDGERRTSRVGLAAAARREQDALWAARGELVFQRAQRVGGRHAIVSVRVLRPLARNARRPALADHRAAERAQPEELGAPGDVRVQAHDPETCSDLAVTLRGWDVGSPAGLGSPDATAQRRAAQFLCRRLEV